MQKLRGYLDAKLMQWARRKYKRLAGRVQASADWLRKMKDVTRGLFLHWQFVGRSVG